MVLARGHSLEKAQTKAFSLRFFGQDCCGQLSMVADQNHLSSFSSKVSKWGQVHFEWSVRYGRCDVLEILRISWGFLGSLSASFHLQSLGQCTSH